VRSYPRCSPLTRCLHAPENRSPQCMLLNRTVISPPPHSLGFPYRLLPGVGLCEEWCEEAFVVLANLCPCPVNHFVCLFRLSNLGFFSALFVSDLSTFHMMRLSSILPHELPLYVSHLSTSFPPESPLSSPPVRRQFPSITLCLTWVTPVHIWMITLDFPLISRFSDNYSHRLAIR